MFSFCLFPLTISSVRLSSFSSFLSFSATLHHVDLFLEICYLSWQNIWDILVPVRMWWSVNLWSLDRTLAWRSNLRLSVHVATVFQVQSFGQNLIKRSPRSQTFEAPGPVVTSGPGFQVILKFIFVNGISSAFFSFIFDLFQTNNTNLTIN